MRKDYMRRLIAGIRREMARDPDSMRVAKNYGEGSLIGRWMDAELLCRVIEKDILDAGEVPAEQPKEQP